MWASLRATRSQYQPRTFYPRGRGLGGSSTVNAQFVIRGLPEDFESYVVDHGCEGWGWDDVVPFFQRAEGVRVPTTPATAAVEAAVAMGADIDDDYNDDYIVHSEQVETAAGEEEEQRGWTTTGPVPVTTYPLRDWQPVDLATRAAATKLAYGVAVDHNAPDTTGVSPFACNMRNGSRVTTNDAYLEP